MAGSRNYRQPAICQCGSGSTVAAGCQTEAPLTMAFCFKRRESVSKAIRRLGRERVEHARECLKERDPGEAIHSARKDIKKIRAVLRLVQPGIGQKKFRRIGKPLGEAAKFLAPSRD